MGGFHYYHFGQSKIMARPTFFTYQKGRQDISFHGCIASRYHRRHKCICQLWVEAGAGSPFPRRELLDRKNTDHLHCFYRLWLNKIKVIESGVFFNSVSNQFVIHTENPSSTLSFLTAHCGTCMTSSRTSSRIEGDLHGLNF